MAGERAALNEIFDVLREAQLDWVIARVVSDWAAQGLDAVIGDDDTVVAARQLLSVANTIETALVPEIQALAYLQATVPEALFQDGRQSLQAARLVAPIDGNDDMLPAAAGAFSSFSQVARVAVLEDWPALRDELR